MSFVNRPSFQIYCSLFKYVFQSVKKNTFIPLVSIPISSIFPLLIVVVLGWRSKKNELSKEFLSQMSSRLLKSSWGWGGEWLTQPANELLFKNCPCNFQPGEYVQRKIFSTFPPKVLRKWRALIRIENFIICYYTYT